MRISDWSSDVCSSDLIALGAGKGTPVERAFDDIGVKERPQILEQPADPRDQRIVAAERVAPLERIIERDEQQRHPQQQRPARRRPPSRQRREQQQNRKDEPAARSEEHTSELQSLMRHSYAVFCSKKKKQNNTTEHTSLLV